MAYFQQLAKDTDSEVNVPMAMLISKEPSWYQEEAHEALSSPAGANLLAELRALREVSREVALLFEDHHSLDRVRMCATGSGHWDKHIQSIKAALGKLPKEGE